MKYWSWISRLGELLFIISITMLLYIFFQHRELLFPFIIVALFTWFLSSIIFITKSISQKDLSEQRKKLDEFRLQTARFINYQENASDAVFLFDRVTVIECNNRTLEMFKCKREDIVGHNPADFSPKYQPNGKTSEEMAEIIFERTVKTGEPQRFEWLHQRPDGTLLEAEVSFSLLNIEGKKIPQAIVRDITQRKKNEAELARYREHLEELVKDRTKELEEEVRVRQKAEAEMQQLFKIAGDGLILFDTNMKAISVNNLMLQLSGKTEEQFITPEVHNCSDCGHDPLDCPVKKIIEKPLRIDYDGELESPEGKIPCMFTLAPYYDQDGELHGIIQSVKNISDRVKAEAATAIEAEQRGRITMTSDMLHDIGNALAGINIFALTPQSLEEWQEILSLHQLKNFISSESDHLKQTLGEEKLAALMNFIDVVVSALQNRKKEELESAEKLARTVKHISAILDLHRYYAKSNYSHQIGVVNMRQLLNDALIILSCNLEKRHIKVETEVTGEHHLISGDRTRLMRMLLNIIKNSYEAFSSINDERERKLEVRLKEIKDNDQLEIIFKDNASGFSPETSKKLFKRDFTSKETGSGIGLPECQAVVESHQGTISIHSEGEGCGTTVIIRLPLHHK